MPADAGDRLRHLLSSGARFVKLAVMARRLADVVALADLARSAGGRAVVIGMGPCGTASRILAAHLGSPWTYAGDGVAPGQLSLARMRDEFQVPAITAATVVYGLVGRPIEHSLSPAMHNAAFRAAGLDAVYVPLPAVDFADFEAFARAFAVRGRVGHRALQARRVPGGRRRRRRPRTRRRQHAAALGRGLGRPQHRPRRLPGAARRAPAGRAAGGGARRRRRRPGRGRGPH